MPQDTEAKAAEQKEIIRSMRQAQSNMKTALDRITLLESELNTAVRTIELLAKELPVNAFMANSSRRMKEYYIHLASDLKAHL